VGCPYPDPSCPIRNGTREELVSHFGVLDGLYVERDDHFFEPLPHFFQGEFTKYKAVLRWTLKPEREAWTVTNENVVRQWRESHDT
jgi:hypothetical protein